MALLQTHKPFELFRELLAARQPSARTKRAWESEKLSSSQLTVRGLGPEETLVYESPRGRDSLEIRAYTSGEDPPEIPVATLDGHPVGRLLFAKLGRARRVVDLSADNTAYSENGFSFGQVPEEQHHQEPDPFEGASGPDLSFEESGDGQTLHVRWSEVESASSYRLYWAPRQRTQGLAKKPHLQTQKLSGSVSGVGPDTYFTVVAEDEHGHKLASAPKQAGPLASEHSGLPAALRHKSLRSAAIEPGAAVSQDLEEHFVVPSGSFSEGLGDWSDVSVEVNTCGGDCQASMVGPELQVTADSDAQSGSPPSVVIGWIRRQGFYPVVFCIVCRVANSTKLTRPNFYGVHTDAISSAPSGPKAVSLPLESYCGAGAEAQHQDSWQVPLDRRTRRLPSEVSGELLTLSPGSGQEPAVAVMKGDLGWSAFVIRSAATGPPDDTTAPILPRHYPKLPTVVAEGPNGNWDEVSMEEYLAAPKSISQKPLKRVKRDGEDRLFDVPTFSEPEEVYYRAPRHFLGAWFDRESFPEDVRSTLAESEEGQLHAVYRGGLLSPKAKVLFPEVLSLSAEPSSSSVALSWELKSPSGEDDLQLQTPVYLKQKNSSEPQSQYATRRASFHGLASDTEYEAWLLRPSRQDAASMGAVVSFRTELAPPVFGVTGQAQPGGEYKYIYEVEDGRWTSWSAPDGTVQTDSVHEVILSSPIEEHTVEFTQRGRVDPVSSTAQTNWIDPSGELEFSQDVSIGAAISPDRFPQPVFRRLRYAGTTARDYDHDVYAPGTHLLRVIGHIPPGTAGTLEDYAEAVFVGPDGEELGSSVTVDVPTSLGVRLRVSATRGQDTPVVEDITVITSSRA